MITSVGCKNNAKSQQIQQFEPGLTCCVSRPHMLSWLPPGLGLVQEDIPPHSLSAAVLLPHVGTFYGVLRAPDWPLCSGMLKAQPLTPTSAFCPRPHWPHYSAPLFCGEIGPYRGLWGWPAYHLRGEEGAAQVTGKWRFGAEPSSPDSQPVPAGL